MARLTITSISEALDQISPEFLNSPQYECTELNQELGCSLILKLETANRIRSFKGRGIDVTLNRYCNEADLNEVICASAGNLGQALAYCATKKGIKSTVFAAKNASKVKVKSMQSLGANIRLVDGDFDLAREEAKLTAIENNALLIEDSEEIGTCEGAGTIGLELIDFSTSIDVMLAALGGGALLSGLGCAFKDKSPSTTVIGVQPIGASAMAKSWQSGRVINSGATKTIADGVAVRKPIPAVLDDLVEVMDDVITVSETSIKAGMRLLYNHVGLVVEPSAALGVAAILENRELFQSKCIATVICGSNVDIQDFNRWIA